MPIFSFIGYILIELLGKTGSWRQIYKQKNSTFIHQTKWGLKMEKKTAAMFLYKFTPRRFRKCVNETMELWCKMKYVIIPWWNGIPEMWDPGPQYDQVGPGTPNLFSGTWDHSGTLINNSPAWKFECCNKFIDILLEN